MSGEKGNTKGTEYFLKVKVLENKNEDNILKNNNKKHDYLSDQQLVNAWNKLCDEINSKDYLKHLITFIKEQNRHLVTNNLSGSESIVDCIGALNDNKLIEINDDQAKVINNLMCSLLIVTANQSNMGRHKELLTKLADAFNWIQNGNALNIDTKCDEKCRKLYLLINTIPKVAGGILSAADIDTTNPDNPKNEDPAHQVIKKLYIKTFSDEDYKRSLHKAAIDSDKLESEKYPELIAKSIQPNKFDEAHLIVWMERMIKKMFDYWKTFFEAKLGKNNHPNISKYLSYARELMIGENRDTPAIIRAWKFIKYIQVYQTPNSTLYSNLLVPIGLIPTICDEVTQWIPPSNHDNSDKHIKREIDKAIPEKINQQDKQALKNEYNKPNMIIECNDLEIERYLNKSLMKKVIDKGYQEAAKSAWIQLWNTIFYRVKKLYRQKFKNDQGAFSQKLENYGHFSMPKQEKENHKNSCIDDIKEGLSDLSRYGLLNHHY